MRVSRAVLKILRACVAELEFFSCCDSDLDQVIMKSLSFFYFVQRR